MTPLPRAALVQLAPRLLQPQANLEYALQTLERTEADLYLLPELYPSGYTFAASTELERVAETADGGDSFSAFSAFARQRGTWVAYGFAERRDGKFYNSANLVGPEGLLATYRKIHLFGRETLFFTPGTEPAPVLDLPFGRVGVMICFDWLFPELTRSLALRGAELILHPSNLVLPHCPDAMVTRSLENRIFTMTCDRVGVEENGGARHAFIGSSQIVSPRGEILARLSRTEEEIAVVTLDLAAARAKKVGEYNDAFADRQPRLYI